MSKNSNSSKIEKLYRFYYIVAKVRLVVTREVSGFPLKNIGYFEDSFFCIIRYVPEYWVSRKMMVSSDVWLLKKQTRVIGLIGLMNFGKFWDQKKNKQIQDGSSKF